MLQHINSFWTTIILIFIYFVNFEAFWGGRTVGKLITGTMVVNKDGTAITFWKALGRTLIRIIPLDPISFLAWDGKLDGWHDKFTRTTVISTRYRKGDYVMDKKDYKAKNQEELSRLYIEKEELINGYLDDIESNNFLKGSHEYNALVDAKNKLESELVNINKEIQRRNK